MQITTTFRHMEPSDALKSYAEEKLERVKKYIDEPIVAQVFLTVEKIRHMSEVTLTAKGITIKASEETNDMYAAIDAVVDKIERQMRRYKERIKAHKPAADTRERQVQNGEHKRRVEHRARNHRRGHFCLSEPRRPFVIAVRT